MKKLDEISKSIDTTIKSIKTSGETGKDLKTIVDSLEKVVKLENDYQKVKNNRIKTEKQLNKEQEKRIKNAEKTNLMLVQRKAKEQALVNEIRKRAREEEVLKREMMELVQLESKAVLSNKELARMTNLMIKKRNTMVVKTRQQAKEYKNLTKRILQYQKQLRQSDAQIGRFQRNVGNYTAGIRKLMMMAGVTGGVLLLRRAFTKIKGIFSGFEKDLSRLQAIIGKGIDITRLEQQAIRLGGATAFTARQIVSLQTELAKLGFSVSEIEAATVGIQNLAAATGTELAESATLAGSTLKIFGLEMVESGRVADVLAKSTSASALDMQKLATALPTVGVTAKNANLSLEETVALLGVLTDRGVDASTAATSLRNIFLELSKKGITMEDALEKIRTSTDKNATSMELFGKRSAAAGVVIAESTEDIEKLEDALMNAEGAAQDMADTMLDNLAGDITLAKSAWEGFVLSVESGDGIISRALRSVTQKMTGLLGVLTQINNGYSFLEARWIASEKFQKKFANTSTDLSNQVKQFTEDNIRAGMEEEAAKKQAIKDTQQLLIADINFQKSRIAGAKQELADGKLTKDQFNERIAFIKSQTILLHEQKRVFSETYGVKKKEENEEIKRLTALLELEKERNEVKKEGKRITEAEFREGMGLEGSKFKMSNMVIGGAFPEIKDEISTGTKEVFEFAKSTYKQEFTTFQKFIRRLRYGAADSWVANLFGLTDEELELAKEQVVQAFNQAMSLWGQYLAQQREVNQELVDMTQERIDSLQEELEALEEKNQKAAESGQAYDTTMLDSLRQRIQQEEAIKKEALSKDKALKQQQKQMDKVQATIGVATSVINAMKLEPTWVAIAMAAVMASLGAVQIGIIDAAQYAEGTRYLERNGAPAGRDTIPIWADEGERILSSGVNARIDRNFPNELIPEAINFYRDSRSNTPILNIWNDELLEGIYNNTKDKGRVYDNGKLVQEIVGNTTYFYN